MGLSHCVMHRLCDTTVVLKALKADLFFGFFAAIGSYSSKRCRIIHCLYCVCHPPPICSYTHRYCMTLMT